MSLNLEVQILGEFKNLTKATKGATKQLKGFQNNVKGIARSINGTLAAIGVGISLNALTNGIKGAVSQASSLEESINAVRVSFGPAADSILALGQNSAKAFGIARSEFNSAAVTFSAFTDEIAGPGGDSAKVIEDLTTRAADFASVFNIDVAEALRVFRSGLSGESEPLKRFGIILNDTAVKQFAYNNRIAETGKELTNTQKIQARYQLLLEETSKTQGDFANTAGSMANALRIARASFADASASIGNGFTPAIAAAAQFVSSNIAVFDALGEAIGNRLREAFDGTGTAATNFGVKIISVVEDLTDFLNGTQNTDNRFVKLQETIGPVIALIGAFGNIIKGLLAIVDGLVDGLFGWINVIPGLDGSVNGFAGTLNSLGLFLQDVGNAIGFVASFFIPLGAAVKIAFGAFVSFTKGFKGFNTVIADTLTAMGNFLNSLQKITNGTGTFGQKVSAVLTFLRSAVGGGNEAIKEGKRQLDSYTKELDARDGKRIRNFIDVITTNRTDSGLIPASPTNDSSRPTGILKPGYREEFIGRDDQWYTRTWTGTGWKIEKMSEAYKTPGGGGGTGDTTFQTRVKAIVAKLQTTLDEARERIKNASESFRDAVGLSFGVITNGFRAKFSVSRVIAQMNRIKSAVATFSKDIIELRKKGADAALIDELIGLGPVAGAAAAKSLVNSSSFDEFINLRRDLASSGAAVGAAGNLAINGTSTSGLTNAINLLNRTIATGKGNTYNISIANPNITPQQIIAQIKAYEKTTGKKVFSN